MTRSRPALLLFAAVFATSCATRSGDVAPLPASPADFAHWSCAALHDEIDLVQQRAADVAYAVDSRAGNNVIALSLGVTVFWPALFAMRPDGPEAVELSRLKGRYEALQANAKRCPPPADTLQASIAAALPFTVGERLVYEERPGAGGPARQLRLRLEATRRGQLEFALDPPPRAGASRWQQDLAGNALAPVRNGVVHWTRLLKRELALGDVLTGAVHDGDGSAGRLRGQVIATGVQTSLNRPFDAAVIELFGEVPHGDASTRIDGVMVVDRKSGVLLRLELHSANPDFALRRTLTRIEPAG